MTPQPTHVQGSGTEDPLLAAVGGQPALTRVVADLYRRILADPDLAPWFAGVDVDRLRAHVVDLLTAAVGADPARHTGREVALAHAGLGVTDEAFDRVAGYLVDALGAAATPDGLVDAVVERITPLRGDVVEA